MKKAVENCFALLLPLLMLSLASQAKQEGADNYKIVFFPNKQHSGIQRKTSSLNERFEKQTIKYLQRPAKKGYGIRQRMEKIDSNRAKQLIAQFASSYTTFTYKIKTKCFQNRGVMRRGISLTALLTDLPFEIRGFNLIGP